MKHFAIFSLLHSKIEIIPNISDDPFLAFYIKTCNLSHKIFYLSFLTILPTKRFYYFTHKIYYLFLLVSPLEMVSPRGVLSPSPRLSTPLFMACVRRH